MQNQLKLPFKEFPIIDLYVSYFRFKDIYNLTKVISDLEGLPEHANSIKVRLDNIIKDKNKLEKKLDKIGYNYKKIRDSIKNKYDAYGRSLSELIPWKNGQDGWKVYYII